MHQIQRYALDGRNGYVTLREAASQAAAKAAIEAAIDNMCGTISRYENEWMRDIAWRDARIEDAKKENERLCDEVRRLCALLEAHNIDPESKPPKKTTK